MHPFKPEKAVHCHVDHDGPVLSLSTLRHQIWQRFESSGLDDLASAAVDYMFE